MKKDKRMKGKFSTLLIKNYIGFTLVLACIIFIIFMVSFTVSDDILRSMDINRILANEKELKAGNYDSLLTKKQIKAGNYIVILDEKNQLSYSNVPEGPPSFTPEEVECITDIRKSIIYQLNESVNDKGEKEFLIMMYDYGNTDILLNESLYAGYILLDKDFKIIRSSMELQREAFTKKEIQYMMGYGIEKYDMLKYPFLNDENKEYTMLLYIPAVDDSVLAKIDKVNSFLWPVFIISYIAVTAIFIIWLNRRISKPLNLLNTAINEFADGKRDKELYYKGSNEFVQICDSFNKMSCRLKESEEQQKKLQEDKQKMLADISHDLKTPITVIQGYSRAICDGLVSEDKKEKYLNTIYHKSDALTDLINTFYEYSKLEHPDFKMVPVHADICEYMREYLAAKYEEIELAEFVLDVEIPEDKVYCDFDIIQLKRVFENIIVNSLKHNPKGTHIFVTLQTVEAKINITIADNGSGIPKELENSVFEPFMVGDASRKTGKGSGLGLAISKKIIELHKGRIALVIPPEAGYKTEFRITLFQSL